MDVHQIHPFVILLAATFTENILLSNFLGMCSFLAISSEMKTSVGLGIAVIFVTAFTALLNAIVYKFVLIPTGLEHFQFIVFIIVIAAFVQLLEMMVERFSQPLYYALGIFLPLITVNCAILGVSLFMVIRNYSLINSFFYGLGSGLGWFLAIVAMAGIRQKVKGAKIPPALEGPGLTIIIAGIMALAFIGFNGMINIR